MPTFGYLLVPLFCGLRTAVVPSGRKNDGSEGGWEEKKAEEVVGLPIVTIFFSKEKQTLFQKSPVHFCLQLRARSVLLDDKEG